MSTDPFSSFTWEPYPSQVPDARRLPCSICGAPGQIVRYRHEEFGNLGSAQVNPNDPPPPDVLAMIAVFCLGCAEKAGYGTYKDRGQPPPHLNHVQRWLAHELDRGDPEHLA